MNMKINSAISLISKLPGRQCKLQKVANECCTSLHYNTAKSVILNLI